MLQTAAEGWNKECWVREGVDIPGQKLPDILPCHITEIVLRWDVVVSGSAIGFDVEWRVPCCSRMVGFGIEWCVLVFPFLATVETPDESIDRGLPAMRL